MLGKLPNLISGLRRIQPNKTGWLCGGALLVAGSDFLKKIDFFLFKSIQLTPLLRPLQANLNWCIQPKRIVRQNRHKHIHQLLNFSGRNTATCRLQTDPTVIYGMGEAYQGNIRKVDLQTPTAYNTYTINGLPPTPIALPSQAAINATLHPSDSKALYFVATGTGGHTFTRTYAEHQAAVADYLNVIRSRRSEQQ